MHSRFISSVSFDFIGWRRDFLAPLLLISNGLPVRYASREKHISCIGTIKSNTAYSIVRDSQRRCRYVTAPSNGLYIKSSSFPSGPCSVDYREKCQPLASWTATPVPKTWRRGSGSLMSFSRELLLLSCLIGMPDRMAVYDGVGLGWRLLRPRLFCWISGAV